MIGHNSSGIHPQYNYDVITVGVCVIVMCDQTIVVCTYEYAPMSCNLIVIKDQVIVMSYKVSSMSCNAVLHNDGHESKPAISIFRIFIVFFINHKVIPFKTYQSEVI